MFIAYGLQPKSCGLMYKIPALDTVAGVAVLKQKEIILGYQKMHKKYYNY